MYIILYRCAFARAMTVDSVALGTPFCYDVHVQCVGCVKVPKKYTDT